MEFGSCTYTDLQYGQLASMPVDHTAGVYLLGNVQPRGTAIVQEAKACSEVELIETMLN
jgi:hypothetical protein